MRKSKIGYSIDGEPVYLGWKPQMGCTAGCPTCWARRQVKRYPCPDCNTFEPHVHQERMDEPENRKKAALILANFEADWMDPHFTDEDIDSVFFSMAVAPWHTFITLTQRPERLRGRFYRRELFKNVYFGLTIRTQAEADERLPIFLKIPGKLWLSIEPIWEPLLIRPDLATGKICGVIVGHDSKRAYRGTASECEAAITAIRRQCTAAGVPCFIKQVWRNGNLDKASDGSLFSHYHPDFLKCNNRLPWEGALK